MLRLWYGFRQPPRRDQTLGLMKVQVSGPKTRQDDQAGKTGAGYESKNCSVAWASRSITKTREPSAVISSHRNKALKAVRASTCHARCHLAQGDLVRSWGLASRYMATLVPVHVASFDTRRASLSPDRLQYWAAWRLSSGRSDVPTTGRCTWVRVVFNADGWLQLLRHFHLRRTPPDLQRHYSASQHKPIRVACEVVRAKTKTRAGYLVAAWPPAHPWTRPPCYGGQDQDGQGRKEARVDGRAYPLSLIAAAGG